MGNLIRRLFWAVLPLFAAAGTYAANAVETPNAHPVKVVLFPFRQAVISARVDSFVKQYRLREGDAFRKDDLIINLEEDNYAQMFVRAKASWEEKKSVLKFAAANSERNEDLFKKGVLGNKELESGKLEKEAAEAQLQFAAANMEIAKLSLDACRVIAPFNGRLAKKVVQDYEYVRTGQPMMEIIDDEQLLAVMYLPSSRRKHITRHQEMQIRIDETGTVHTGRIYEISAQIDPRSRTFEVKVLIDNRDRKLTAGMAGTLVNR